MGPETPLPRNSTPSSAKMPNRSLRRARREGATGRPVRQKTQKTQKTVRTTTLTRARGRKKKRTVGWGPRAIARPPAPRVVPNATRASEARENRAVERARAPEHLALVRSERADVVGRLVDGDEQVPRVLPLVLAAQSRRAGRRAALLVRVRGGGALLRPALLPEPLNRAQDGPGALLRASSSRHGQPRVPFSIDNLAVARVESHRPGLRARRPPAGLPERLRVDEVYQRANARAVVQLELVLQRAVAHVFGDVDAEAALGGLVDVQDLVVVVALVVVSRGPRGRAIERELDLVVRPLFLPELVRAASMKGSRRSERGARGRRGARRDAGTVGDGGGGARGISSRVFPREPSEIRARGATHRTSCVSRFGSTRSMNPFGCDVITGHGMSVDGSSSIAPAQTRPAPRAGAGAEFPLAFAGAPIALGRNRDPRARATVVRCSRTTSALTNANVSTFLRGLRAV
jgi:hypothetical protein